MKKTFLAFILALSLLTPAGALRAQTTAKAKLDAAPRRAAEDITAAQLRDYLMFVAADEMEGRDTPSRGLDLTAKFLATMMARWGVKPAGDNGTYFQKMTLSRDAVDTANAAMEIGGQRYPHGEEFFRIRGNTNGALSAPLVYVGSGWLVKSKNIDAYQGVDARGKIAVVQMQGTPTNASLTTLPKGVTNADLKREGRGTEWIDPATYAQQKGAVGVIYVASPEIQSFWGQVKGFLGGSGRLRVEGLDGGQPGNQNNLPIFLVSQKIGNQIFTGAPSNPIASPNEIAAFDIANAKLSATVPAKSEKLTTQNVVGMIEGSDPTLKAEMVAIGAHYDHVGMNPNTPGEDKIFNGADDDGSGTVAVLAIAEAIAKAPKKPKRSVLFVWHAGEEKGLWGSEYFVKFPTVPIDKVVAQFNIDMIGRSKREGDTDKRNAELSGANEIYVIGSKMMSSELGDITESVNKSFLNLSYNFRYDDPKDPNRFFFRSDHFNYAQKGIPIVFWFDGVHEDYHRPGDHADKIDYQKMEKISRTILATLWTVADRNTRPVVDKQLPAELTSR